MNHHLGFILLTLLIIMSLTTCETRRKKHPLKDKTALWNIFDAEINGINNTKPLECMHAIESRDFCERCSSILAISDEGFLVCTNKNCSIVYHDTVDQTAEWRFYGTDDNQTSDPARCGMPINPLLEESSYGCKVLPCIGSMTYEMRKLRRYTEWQSMPYKEKSQYDEFQRVTLMANNAGIPKMIVDTAIQYHKRISESDTVFRGENRDGIIAASIYLACRKHDYPRTAKEIAHIFHLDSSSATKGCKNALFIIDSLERDVDDAEKTNFGYTKPSAFMERYCSKLNMNSELTRLCQFIANKIIQLDVMPENTPPSIAAGIIYFVAQLFELHINKLEIRRISDISEVTINKCFKKLDVIHKSRGLVPSQLLEKYGKPCVKLTKND
jgi:transcription initiation factor TFIIB